MLTVKIVYTHSSAVKGTVFDEKNWAQMKSLNSKKFSFLSNFRFLYSILKHAIGGRNVSVLLIRRALFIFDAKFLEIPCCGAGAASFWGGARAAPASIMTKIAYIRDD